MKENFNCSLTGSQWWKQYLGFLVLFLALFIPLELAAIKMSLPGAGNALSSLLFILVMLVLIIVLDAAFTIILAKIIYRSIGVRGEPFAFTGEIGPFIKLTLIGSLLSIVTLGFYFPWFTKKLTDYIAQNSEYRGEKAAFLGKPGKLLKYFLLALWLPLIVWIAVFMLLVTALTVSIMNSGSGAVAFGILAAVVYIAIFIVIVPFLYLTYKWYFDIQWKDTRITWKTEFWPSCLMITGQILLTIITVGIYWPALYIKCYRYFAARTVLETAGKETARLGFEGRAGSGFGLLWGQTLLSILTLGIYLPWAYANCMRYFINGTFVEDKQELIGQ